MQIVYYAAASLDSFIAPPDGSADWLNPFHDEADEAGIAAFFETIDGIVMGSTTYEFALAHPPWLAPDTPSWVFTNRDLPIADPSVTLTHEDPATFARDRKQDGHKKLWLMGGGRLAASFRKESLITHYEITTIPVILGEGIPLLQELPQQESLELLSSKPLPSGLITSCYKTGCEV